MSKTTKREFGGRTADIAKLLRDLGEPVPAMPDDGDSDFWRVTLTAEQIAKLTTADLVRRYKVVPKVTTPADVRGLPKDPDDE